MEAAQIHLALNHFPIAGLFISLIFFLVCFIVKSETLKISSIGVVLFSSLILLPVYFSGDGVESAVKRKPMVSRYHIKEHEEAAELAMAGAMLLIASSIAWIILHKSKHKFSDSFLYVVFFLNIIVALSVADTAHKGGMIRHDEIRPPGSVHDGLMD